MYGRAEMEFLIRRFQAVTETEEHAWPLKVCVVS